MSRIDHIDALEKQLADLQMAKDLHSTGKVKKVPPAVPPKKKAQPQVPHSAAVNTVREPSYSAKITPFNNMQNVNVAPSPPPLPPPPTYSNVPRQPSAVHPFNKDYANVTQLSLPNPSFRHNLVPSKNFSTVYSNVHNSSNVVPPPPPPPPPPFTLTTSKPFDPNQNTDDLMPPPSPVSSNYSELMRATANINFNNERSSYPAIYQNEYPEYNESQTSNYESLYEPINLHNASNTAQTNNNQVYRNSLNSMGRSPLPKEEEVDALTNMLVQSISESQDLDIIGTCVKCEQKVIEESSGCTAMGNMYHVQCFRCYRCNTNLQGKPFYAVEGNPYCEIDYRETLEKCSVCNDPILDRILRATGKPYHPSCFTCVVCGKSLDGIPFTVDAMSQIHCIEDFHKKFAPRCCVCELPIMPEEGEEETLRVVALDRSFHVNCYKCEDCGLLLSSKLPGRACYPLDNHILCKACNAHRIRMLTNVMTTDL